MNFEIKNVVVADIPEIRNVQPADWPDITPVYDFYYHSDFCFPLKVVSGTQLVGAGTAIIHGRTAWLGHIIVHEAFRNRGIGADITSSLVKTCQEKNVDIVYLIATDLGAPVYSKLGFETETEYVFFKEIKPDPEWETSMNILPFNSTFKQPLADLDRNISGEERMNHLEPFLESGYVYYSDGKVEGYYLPQFGEGMINAVNSTAGLELMKLRMITKKNACFPRNNQVALEFMHKHHFNGFKTAKRMRLGPEQAVSFQNIYNRIGGNLG